MGLSKTGIFDSVVSVMQGEFEIPPERLRPDAHLIDDLDLDSIDAIDLAVRLEERLGVSFDEDDLKSLRTLQDVVDLIHERL